MGHWAKIGKSSPPSPFPFHPQTTSYVHSHLKSGDTLAFIHSFSINYILNLTGNISNTCNERKNFSTTLLVNIQGNTV